MLSDDMRDLLIAAREELNVLATSGSISAQEIIDDINVLISADDKLRD